MKITISINTDNAALCDSSPAFRAEVTHILNRAAGIASENRERDSGPESVSLFDSNGNRVGFVKMGGR